MPEITVKPIRVVALGMDDHARNMYNLVFTKHAAAQYTLVDINQAEACIFDLDGYGAQKLWENYRIAHPELPTLVLSLREKQFENTQFVKKPINVREFLNTLTLIKEAVEERRRVRVLESYQPNMDKPRKKEAPAQNSTPVPMPVAPSVATSLHKAGNLMASRHSHSNRYASEIECGQLPDINIRNAEQLEKIYYDPQQHFQGIFENAVREAKEKKSCFLLEGFIGKMMLNPAKNQLMITSPEDTLHSLMLLATRTHALKTLCFDCIDLPYYVQSTSLPFRYSYLDQFHWKVAIWSAHGRLPAGTSLEEPIILLHWPNLTRLLLTPYALQIAALWSERPLSLLETAQGLGIPQRYVFSFYSAAHATGLAFPERRSQQRREEDERYQVSLESLFKPNEQKRSLLKRILSHLHFS